MMAGSTDEYARRVAHERRSALALGLFIALAVALRLVAPDSFAEIRLRDLTRVRAALEAYKKAHGSYPGAPYSTAWNNGRHVADWIPGLVPQYLDRLPEDPRGSTEWSQQYLYRSDGIDYKIICHGPEDFALVTARDPKLIDPRRSTWAYGYWTPGGKEW